MSTAEACLELPPSRPAPTPIELARAHQRAIRECHTKASTDAACVRQLMAGRYVRRKRDEKLFLVVEVRLTLGWIIQLYGRGKGQKARTPQPIGGIDDVEIINTGGNT